MPRLRLFLLKFVCSRCACQIFFKKYYFDRGGHAGMNSLLSQYWSYCRSSTCLKRRYYAKVAHQKSGTVCCIIMNSSSFILLTNSFTFLFQDLVRASLQKPLNQKDRIEVIWRLLLANLKKGRHPSQICLFVTKLLIPHVYLLR